MAGHLWEGLRSTCYSSLCHLHRELVCPVLLWKWLHHLMVPILCFYQHLFLPLLSQIIPLNLNSFEIQISRISSLIFMPVQYRVRGKSIHFQIKSNSNSTLLGISTKWTGMCHGLKFGWGNLINLVHHKIAHKTREEVSWCFVPSKLEDMVDVGLGRTALCYTISKFKAQVQQRNEEGDDAVMRCSQILSIIWMLLLLIEQTFNWD